MMTVLIGDKNSLDLNTFVPTFSLSFILCPAFVRTKDQKTVPTFMLSELQRLSVNLAESEVWNTLWALVFCLPHVKSVYNIYKI